MRKLTLFLASFLLVFVVFGQNVVQKSTIQQYQTNQVVKSTTNQLSDEERYALMPKTASGHIKCIVPTSHQPEDQFESWISEKIAEINLLNNSVAKASRNIPVVVHVLHNGDAIGSGENISVAQIQSQIDVLNEDFSATNGDVGSVPGAFAGDVVDSDIQFCLALTDPFGAATTGINRINVGVASVSDTDIETNYGLNNMWDPTKYLNIFVGNLTGGLLGKAVFPTGSGLAGMPGGGAPAYDGVMCGATAFGRVGNVGAPYNLGRTTTHEIGHWLGLRHIWGDSNCGSDFCNDTPTQQTSNGGCPTYPSATCGNSGDMSMNYMDYTNDACMYMFTNDQKARMDAVLANSPQRVELLTSNRCQPPAISADFTADFTTINVGGSVNFTDASVSPNTLNSWTWYFPGGTPNTWVGQTPPPIVYNTQGQYDVSLAVTDNAAAYDSIYRANYINVVVAGICDTLNNPPAGTVVTYTSASGYLSGWNEYSDISKAELIPGDPTYPYITGGLFGIRSANDGGNGATVDFNVWDNTGAAGAPGAIIGSVTVNLSDLDFNAGYENTLVEIMFPEAINVGSADYYFGYTMNGFQATDTLGMFSNTNGDSSPGTGWEQWSDLSWTTLTAGWGIDVTQYIAPYRSQNAPTATITTNTTSICEGETVDFDASTSVDANSYDWVFNGGSPTSSTNTAETVTYASSGTPRAYLIAYGNCGAIAIDSVDITVNAPVTPTFTQMGPYCVGDTPGTLPTTSDNAITGTWDAAISTASAGTVTYTFTPAGSECATTATMDVVVNANVTPTFTQMGPYCVGDTPGTLPTTSDNAIAGTWDAAISTASAGSVTYTFTPSGGCATTATMDVVVNANVTPTFTQMGPYCVGDTPGTLPTTSDNAIAGTWDAAISTASAGTVTYTFTPSGGGCASTATMDVVVNANVTPTFTQMGPYCVGDTPGTLPTTSDNAIAGTWDAAISTASAGTVTYTFTPSGGGCTTTATMDVVVNSPVVPTFTQMGPYCIGATPGTLPTTSDNAIAGTWDAAISTASAGTVTYTFTPSGGCATTATMDVVVSSSVTPTFTQMGPYCVGDTPGTLPTTSDNAIAGTWDAAISTASAGTVTYTFTPSGGGCATTTTMDVVVSSSVTPTFTQMGPYCVGDTPGTLPTTSDNAIAGTWDAAISTASAGTVTYTFTPSGGGCATTATMDVVVNANVTPTFTQMGPYCIGATPGTLPTTSDNAITGTWDAAISTASAGTVTYTFTPTGGCATTATMDVVVSSSVTPTFTQMGPYCVGDTPGTLPTTSDNAIAGTWDAAISTASAGTVTYTFTPSGGGCAIATTMDVVVNTCVGIEELNSTSVVIYPNPATEMLTIETSSNEVSEVRLINILGETLVRKSTNSSIINVNVSEFSMGVYFVQLMNDKGQVILTEKISVK